MLLLDSEVPVHDVDDTVLTRASNPNKPMTKVQGIYVLFDDDNISPNCKNSLYGKRLVVSKCGVD